MDDEYADIDQSEDFLDSDKEDEALEQEEEQKPEVEDYGTKVQKRINKEVSKRKILEDENVKLNERLSNLEQTFHSKAEETSNADLTARMKELQTKRKEMYDVGDIDPSVEDEWQDLRYEQRKANERQAQQQPEAQQQQPQRQVPQAQQEWIDSNSDWYGVDTERTTKANETFQRILDAGFSETHPAAYEEFDKLLQPSQERGKAAPPPASPSGVSSAPRTQAKLNRDDFDMMREMGMDPHNAAHRKQLLANRRA